MITSQITGTVLHAKCATFKDDNNNDVSYGKIQILTPDMSGDFSAIQNIKVRTANFGWIPDVADKKGKQVSLDLETNTYQGKVSYYLAGPVSTKAA